MFLKWLQQHLPKKERIRNSSSLSGVRKYLSHPYLWKFNPHSTERGVVIGLLLAFIPLPIIQTLGAAIFSIYFRANLPIAVLMTLVSNPFTFLPINYLIFIVGKFVTGNKMNMPDITQLISTGHSWTTYKLLIEKFGKIYLVGLPIVSMGAALIGYGIVVLLWYIKDHIKHKK